MYREAANCGKPPAQHRLQRHCKEPIKCMTFIVGSRFYNRVLVGNRVPVFIIGSRFYNGVPLFQQGPCFLIVPRFCNRTLVELAGLMVVIQKEERRIIVDLISISINDKQSEK